MNIPSKKEKNKYKPLTIINKSQTITKNPNQDTKQIINTKKSSNSQIKPNYQSNPKAKAKPTPTPTPPSN
jgi:hypothetical protein